jgi:branched-chain amino acid transport system substrate-binding protein
MTQRCRWAAVLLLFASCRGGGGTDEIVVGEYSSLTGTTATFGQSTHNGIVMALGEANRAGGVLGRKIRLVTEDDQSRPEEAATAATKLIHQDRVVALLGEVASSRSLAVAPIAQANKVVMITPSSTHPRVTETGDYVFRVCFVDGFQAPVMARFVAERLGLKRVAILYDVRNEYSLGLRQFFTETFQRLGGTVVAEQSFGEGDSDFRAQLTALRPSRPEALYVPGYYTEAATIARQSRELGLTVPLLGGDGWDSQRLFEIGGAALEGSYITNHYSPDDPSPLIQGFVSAYRAKHGVAPDSLAALGYDAARILVDALKRAGSTETSRLRDALAATRQFAGVTGSITLDAKRNAVKPVVLLKVDGGRFRLVETYAP